jgi:hypothetical protein
MTYGILFIFSPGLPMNLKEFLFYFNINAKELAEEFGLSHSYVRNVISGSWPLSHKFAEKVEEFSHGIVKQNDVNGPFTHPTYKKIMRDESHPFVKRVRERKQTKPTNKG